jgi:hypothetical protein
MQPGGSYPRANTTNDGRYGNGGVFPDGRGQQPYRPPAQPEATPREREEILMAAGRLAAEYFVARGDLPPDVLENRPPAPLPSRQPPAPRAFHQFQGCPPAPQHRPFQWELRPHVPHQRRQPWSRPFQGGGPGSFPKRPRFAAPRPYPYGGARGPAPPKPGYAGQGAAAPAATSRVEKDNEHSAPAGDTSGSLRTAQPASGVSATPSAQQTNQPTSRSLGSDDSK